MKRRPSRSGGERVWALIAGGGTAGHVLPGIAVGRALLRRGHPSDTIHFVGSARGIEARLVPEAGFRVTVLPGRGIQRRLTLANVGALWGLTRAVGRALLMVGRWRPAVVVALGGYASVPCALAAVLMRVPIVVAEQNAVAGAANRLVARFARASAVSFPGTALPRSQLTGNPVREAVLAIDRQRDRDRARQALGLPPDRRVVAIFGGSLGARRINQAALGLRSAWAGRADVAVRHVIGERDWHLMMEELAGGEGRHEGEQTPAGPATEDGHPRAGLVYQPVKYEHRMDLLLAAADVAVCRAGATTVAELAAVGLPSVLVPLPGAPGDHQTANARALAGAGGAVVVPDGELDGARLVAELEPLLAEPRRLEDMGRAAAAAARRDAAERVAALVEEHARRG